MKIFCWNKQQSIKKQFPFFLFFFFVFFLIVSLYWEKMNKKKNWKSSLVSFLCFLPQFLCFLSSLSPPYHFNYSNLPPFPTNAKPQSFLCTAKNDIIQWCSLMNVKKREIFSTIFFFYTTNHSLLLLTKMFFVHWKVFQTIFFLLLFYSTFFILCKERKVEVLTAFLSSHRKKSIQEL